MSPAKGDLEDPPIDPEYVRQRFLNDSKDGEIQHGTERGERHHMAQGFRTRTRDDWKLSTSRGSVGRLRLEGYTEESCPNSGTRG